MSAQFPTTPMPARLPLVVQTSNRSSSVNTDARLVNCYIEVDQEDRLFIYKRPGLESYGIPADGQTGRGAFFWNRRVYSIFGNKLYRDGVEVASGLDTSDRGSYADSTSGNGTYVMSEILGAVPKMVISNGTKTYAYDDVGGLTADLHTIDIDFPEFTVKGLAYLQGPMYVMQPQAVIWGSVVNSVSVAGDWDPLNFISSQIEPDPGVALNKQLVYVVAFNSWSTEIFFDAGNPTGSPLAPVMGSKSSYGCANSDSVQRIDDRLIWLCVNQTASLQVALMDQLSVNIVSTAAIDRLLEAVDYSWVYSWQIKLNGHSFYVITFKNSNLTLAYDIIQQQWSQWTDANGNYMPIVSATYNASGQRILQHESNGRLYSMSSSVYKDLNDPIPVDIYTPIFDAGSKRRKTLNTLYFVADQIEGSTLEVRCSDDDYRSWSQPRQVDLGAETPHLINCGTFRKRAYNLRHRRDTFFRIEALEAQYDVGTL